MKQQQENMRPLDKTPQELLLEIRSLLSPKQHEQTRRHLTPSQIDDMLKDSYEHSQVLKRVPSLKLATQQKVKQATLLLQNSRQPAFVQQYAKQKINSEMFTPLRSNISEQEQLYYQRQREELLRQRMHEDQEQQQRQRLVIETTKKFMRYESKKLPYADINVFTQKEGNSSRAYLLNQAPEKTEASVNNRIDQSMTTDLQAKFEEMKETKLQQDPSQSRFNEINDDDIIEIIDQDENLDQQQIQQKIERNVFKALKGCPIFVRAFRQILVNQLTLQKLLNDEGSSKYRSSLNRSQSTFKYKNEPINLSKKSNQPQAETVASLTKKYKSKGIVLREMGLQSAFKSLKTICQKTINKMVGVSNDYHPKKAVLYENELSWCEEKEEMGPESKKVELTIQNIKVQKKNKDQGSFFSKKTTQVEVVVIEGSNRNLIFQKNYLQGGALYQQLCHLMAQKIYQLSIIIGCRINERLHEFISNKKAAVFDISNEFLQPHDKYPTRDYRIMIISILTSLFPFRNEVTRINCNACRTNVEENNMLFKSFRFSNVQEIVISETKFNAQSLSSITAYMATLANKLNINFSNCMIDDSVLLAARESFVRCTNIHKLDISLNSFTLQGFSVILDMGSRERSVLSQLNISENMINNLAVIGELIKRCKTMDVLIAENCGFSFESDQQLKQFFQNCRNSRLRKLSFLRNDLVNSLKYFQDFWLADTPKEINVDLGIYTEKTSKNLQGKLL